MEATNVQGGINISNRKLPNQKSALFIIVSNIHNKTDVSIAVNFWIEMLENDLRQSTQFSELISALPINFRGTQKRRIHYHHRVNR